MNKRQWENGKRSEIDFWSKWIKTKGLEWKEDYINRLDVNLPLQDYLVKYLPKGPEVSILDVGAGPLTPLGKILPGYEINITAVDPLAKEYDAILGKHRIIPTVRTQFGEVERLSEQFPSNLFDLIHVSNALDHSYNPLEGIKQMLIILKKNSFIFMSHFTNEAEKENYNGFHQWNFCEENNQFIIWDKDTTINVNDVLAGKAEVMITGNMNSNVVEIKKTKDAG